MGSPTRITKLTAFHNGALGENRQTIGDVNKTIRGLKAGIKGFIRGLGPGHYEAGGRQVVCPHCGAKTFAEHEALLNTTGATFAKLDWLNKSGTALICENCGLIQWFGMRPESIP